MQDLIVPLDYLEAYIKYAEQLGEDVANWKFDNSGHFEVVHPDTEAGTSVAKAISELFEKTTRSTSC